MLKHKTNIITTLILLTVLFVSKNNYAQHGKLDTLRVHAYITPLGDTIPMGYLPSVEVYTKLSPRAKRYWAEWTRLRKAVYVTYPYAIAASRIMNEINAKLVGINDRKQRKKIIRSREKELRKEFADKLTQLSVYQGKVLMKLIYRQTGSNCYEIIDEYKGSFTAAFYQTIAIIFGSNLKQTYDAHGKDEMMEKIVVDVERMYGYRS
ncbi:MAG: DUF4294 domain-containing protein [Chitinophagales bacterium]|nr:DUF4294 domain-containing protein [Chitinophagales bacterium]